MRIQENTGYNYNYSIRENNNVKAVVTTDKKVADIKDEPEKKTKEELAKEKEMKLKEAEEEQRKKSEEAKEELESKKMEARHLGVILETFRRVANGDRVSPKDESALMEYDMKLYLRAKTAGQLANNKKPKKYKKSLIAELEEMEKERQEKKAREAEKTEKNKESEPGESLAGDNKKETGETLGTNVDVSV